MGDMVKAPVDLEGQPATLATLGAVEVLDEGDGFFTIIGPDLVGEGVSRDTLIALQALLDELLSVIV